jgi:MFS family permease
LTDHKALFDFYRKRISRLHLLWLLGCGVMLLCALITPLLFSLHRLWHLPFYLIAILSVLFIITIVLKKNKMLRILQPTQHEPWEQLYQYITEQAKRWHEQFNIRAIILGSSVLLMIVLMVTTDQNPWTVMFASIFILGILASMMRSWMLFQDEILAHDIKRSFADHPSDISV